MEPQNASETANDIQIEMRLENEFE